MVRDVIRWDKTILVMTCDKTIVLVRCHAPKKLESRT